MSFKSKNQKKTHYKILFYPLLILIIIIVYSLIFQKIYSQTIYPNVYCQNLDIGGLKAEEAKVFLNIATERIERKGLSFQAQTDLGEVMTTIPSSLIGLTDPDLSRQIISFDTEKALINALLVGRTGNIWQRFFKKFSILMKSQVVVCPVYVNQKELRQILEEKFGKLEKPSQNAEIVLENNKLKLNSEINGFVLDYNQALKELSENLANFDNQEIVINSHIDKADISAEDSSSAFTKAQGIFDKAPYILKYEDREWNCSSHQISKWFIFQEGLRHQVDLFLNQEELKLYLEEIAGELDVAPVETRLEIDDNNSEKKVTEFQAGQSGMVLNIETSKDIITRNILFGDKEDIILKVDKITPVPLPNDLDSLGIQEFIAQGSSNFAGSPKNRRHNIRIGSEILHGILILPDQEFSLVQALGEIDKEAGFLPELVIKGDRTVPEYGGGLCQIGTTMFRLAFNTGLPITERASHSYRVFYYEPAGTDATIYTPHPDLRFINDTGYHLLLQTKIKDNDLIFEFYGTSDGRQVFNEEPEIFNITQPGPVKFIETEELEFGEKKRIESAHAGADTKFENIITFPNGIVRREIWRSHYKAWPEVWMVGKALEHESIGTLEH